MLLIIFFLLFPILLDLNVNAIDHHYHLFRFPSVSRTHGATTDSQSLATFFVSSPRQSNSGLVIFLLSSPLPGIVRFSAIAVISCGLIRNTWPIQRYLF